MSKEAYDIVPWKKYRLADNGVYAPKGSNPTFHVELRVFNNYTNPMHPFALGYIMHDQMKGDELVPRRQIFISSIIDDITPQPRSHE